MYYKLYSLTKVFEYHNKEEINSNFQWDMIEIACDGGINDIHLTRDDGSLFSIKNFNYSYDATMSHCKEILESILAMSMT
jgi:hypothetical protein